MKHWLEVTKLDLKRKKKRKKETNQATSLIHVTQRGGGPMNAWEKIDLNVY